MAVSSMTRARLAKVSGIDATKSASGAHRLISTNESTVKRPTEYGVAVDFSKMGYPGALYHVMLQGNISEDIFFEDEDRRHFLGLVEEGVIRFRHRIQAFCLMANHVLQLDSRIVKPDPDSFRSEVSLKIISIKLLFLKYFLLI